MTREILIGLMLCVIAGCTGPNGGDIAGRSDTRQVPSNTEPGVHISGYVNVGAVRSF